MTPGDQTPSNPISLRALRRPVLGLLFAGVVLMAAELVARGVLGEPPRTWQAATGWAGCWFREHEVPGGENRFGPCVPDGFPSPTQQWPLTAREPRVMVLGGSSVFVGRDKPWPHFPDVLDQRLTGIRVLNGGVPGVNSAGVLQRVRALREHDVDAFVIYTGHNDVASRIFGSTAAVTPSLVMARAERSWLFHGIRRLLHGPRPSSNDSARNAATSRHRDRSPPEAEPLFDAAGLAESAATLQANLEAAVAAAAPRPVVLVTPISNPLWPPIATAPGSEEPELSGDCDRDRTALESPETALAAWRSVQAARQCADRTWLLAAAADVRRLDAAPLRAPPALVQAVRNAADQSGALLVDLEETIPVHQRASARLFADPLHFDRSGHKAVAKALEEAVIEVSSR